MATISFGSVSVDTSDLISLSLQLFCNHFMIPFHRAFSLWKWCSFFDVTGEEKLFFLNFNS